MDYKLAAAVACLGLLTSSCTPNTDVDTSTTSEGCDTSKPTESTAPEEQSSTVDAYLADLESEGFEGIVLIKDGDETTSRGFGLADGDTETPNETDTIFDDLPADYDDVALHHLLTHSSGSREQ